MRSVSCRELLFATLVCLSLSTNIVIGAPPQVEYGVTLCKQFEEAARKATGGQERSLCRISNHCCDILKQAAKDSIDGKEFLAIEQIRTGWEYSRAKNCQESRGESPIVNWMRQQKSCSVPKIISRWRTDIPASVTLSKFLYDCGVWNRSYDTQLPTIFSRGHVDKNGTNEPAVAFVTAASKTYFNRVRNLVGSVHVFAVRCEVILYDIGLSSSQRREAKNWPGVKIIDINMCSIAFLLAAAAERYLSINESHTIWHEKRATCDNVEKIDYYHGMQGEGWETSSYAFKFTVIVDALMSLQKPIIWLDSGVELHSSILGVEAFVRTNQLLLIPSGWPFPNPFAFEGTFEQLGTQSSIFEDILPPLREVQTSIMGFDLRGDLGEGILNDLLLPSLRCSLSSKCIAPDGSSKKNHRQDQTVFNVVLYTQYLFQVTSSQNHGHSVPQLPERARAVQRGLITSLAFRCHLPAHENLLPRNFLDQSEFIIFCNRRNMYPKPYSAFATITPEKI